MLDRCRRLRLQLFDPRQLNGQRPTVQLGPQPLGRDHDEAFEFVDGFGAAWSCPGSADCYWLMVV